GGDPLRQRGTGPCRRIRYLPRSASLWSRHCLSRTAAVPSSGSPLSYSDHSCRAADTSQTRSIPGLLAELIGSSTDRCWRRRAVECLCVSGPNAMPSGTYRLFPAESAVVTLDVSLQ